MLRRTLGHVRPDRRLVRAHAPRSAPTGASPRGPWGQTAGWSSRSIAPPPCSPGSCTSGLPELGIDVSVIYPSFGLLFGHFDDERDRPRRVPRAQTASTRVCSRSSPTACCCRSPRSRCTRPDEAVDELEHRGVARVPGRGDGRVRGNARSTRSPRSTRSSRGTRCGPTTFGLDSAYDYDPVWQKCRELGIAPAFHSSAMGWQNRASISSYVFKPRRDAR